MSTNTEFTKVEKFPVGNTGNALTSLSDDHIIGTAGDIYDTDFREGAYQSEINRYLDNNFSSYLPLTGGEINGTVIFKDDNNGEISIGSNKIKIGGSNANSTIELSIGSGGYGDAEINIGSGLQIGSGLINIGSGSEEISIGSGEISIGSGLLIEFTGISIGSGSEEISIDYEGISIGSGYEGINIGSGSVKFGANADSLRIDRDGIIIGTNLKTNITNTSISFKDEDTNESNEFNIYGVKYPLTVLYRDVNNNPVEFEYKAGNPVEGDNYSEEPGNNLNTIDLSRGVYYATTSKTATKVSNELTLKQGDSVIYYNGQLKETFDVTPLKEITYNELKTLRDNNELLPGQQYRITDYVTTTNGDGGTNSAGNAFNIIVKAKTSNELSENAKAIKPKFTNLYTVFNDYNPNNINTITAKYYVNNNITAANWTGVELNKIPNGILNLPDLGFVPSTDTDIRSIKLASGGSYDLNLSAGKYWVLINYISGNNRLNTVGAELVAKGTDTVISSDYHIGYTGHQYSNRLYCLEVPSSGIYNIKCYIIAHKNYDNGQVNAEVNIQAGSFNNNINSIIPFINNNLSAWELKYSIENTSNIVNWVKSDGKGHIYYMKDEFGNECNYDFKNIRYGNYYTFDYEIDGKHIDGSSVYGNLCYNNVISMDVSGANGKLGFAKIYFKNTNTSAQCHSNRILHDNWEIIFGNNCYDNYIGEKSQFITIGNNCHHNIIKCNSQHITLNNDCYSNTIDIGCETINFGESCHHNIIKCSSKSITLNTACHSNTIGIGCETINFGDRCRNNILNDGCLRNTFESQCIANTMDNDCNDNTFDSQCCDNKLGRLSNNNSFGEGSSNNILGNNCTYNKFGTNCSLNTLGNNCIHNKFGVDGANCSLNTLGNNCEYNEFISNCSENIFGEYCSLNKFGSQCNKNIFELRCHSNVFGNNCYSNIFNINCYSNNFGANCFYNRFGIDCKNNLLTSNCHSNTFGNYCWDNKFGHGVFANTFGIDCSNIQIITAENSTNLLQFVRNFKFGNYCNKLKIYPKVSVTTADIAAGYLQNFEFGNNLGSTSQYTNIALEGTAGNLLDRKYITRVDKDSNGTIIQKCLMDIDKNINFSYKNGTLTITTISTK